MVIESLRSAESGGFALSVSILPLKGSEPGCRDSLWIEPLKTVGLD